MVSDEKVECRKKPGLIQRLFFWWLCPIFYWGNKRDLDESDLVETKKIYKSKILGDELERNWKLECEEALRRGRIPSLLRVLFKTYKWRYFIPMIPTFIDAVFRTVLPMLFARLLKYWTPNTTTSLEEATMFAILIVLSTLLSAFFMQHGIVLQLQLGMSIRIALTSLMYRKMLRMSSKSLTESSVGKMINIMSNDLSRFDLVFNMSHQVLLLPFQLVVIIYFMYMAMGISAIVGAAVIAVVMTPLQVLLTKGLNKMRGISAVRTDSRIKTMDEIIKGIKVIKMYAWEDPFAKIVHDTRRNEIQAITRASWARVGLLGFQLITLRASLLFTMTCYMLLGHQVTADVIFPIQQFFNLIQMGIGVFVPQSLVFVTETVVSFKRIQEFLNLEEIPDIQLLSSEGKEVNGNQNSVIVSGGNLNKGYVDSETPKVHNENIIELTNIEARWTAKGPVTLSSLSLKIKPGQLCAVVGSVGSGKSSLLRVLLNELPYTEGSFIVNGRISYAAQETWLFPKSVRDNILFGMPYDPVRYHEVCRVCCLERDFKQFPFGDQTLVGERGVILSGGQRARINLARAVYREADIYLLDDPLSAVDTKVGRNLFENCILGYLKGKTIILATHQLHFLTSVDVIVMIDDGRIESIGKFEELLRTSKAFKDLLSSRSNNKHKEEEEKTKEVQQYPIRRSNSKTSDKDENVEENEVQKIAPEKRSKGTLKFSVVTTYCTSGGFGIFTLTVLFVIFAQGVGSLADIWLSFWMNEVAKWEAANGLMHSDENLDIKMGPFTSGQYLLIYAVLIGLCFITMIIRTFTFVDMCMKSSTALHNKMFSSMLTAVMKFFDTSSTGRILNRFSKDIGALDEMLPRSMLDSLQLYTIALSAMILNAIALPLTIVMSIILILINYILTKLYLNTSQALKRLEGTTKSPVFGLVSTSLNGITTIRSSNAQERLIDTFDETQDMHTNACNTALGGSAAFGHFFDIVFAVYLSLLFFVFLYVDFGDLIPIGDVGLAVSQTLNLTIMLQFGARSASEMMAQLTAVERVLEYTNLETEEHLKEGRMKTPKDWPSKGGITFIGVDMSYGSDSPPVIKNLTFRIPAGAKVGIVGRTGAGKSSLIAALFRFAKIRGRIIIDDIDTELIAKQELRSSISIIPQEPVLFSATIRYNLDPFNRVSDEEIWKALELVELKDSIPALDFQVSEGGGNFSVGERQLVCLARAVLTSNKILVMDEATANIDPQTDSLIQKTIRSQFASCTVLTIAHRLNTIMDSDLVLVMDTGEICEFDHPHILLSDSNSVLSGMVNETGTNMAIHLEKIAMDAYFNNV